MISRSGNVKLLYALKFIHAANGANLWANGVGDLVQPSLPWLIVRVMLP